MVLTISEPVGVVCALTPWNFPLAIPAWKLAPGPRLRQPGGLEAGDGRIADRRCCWPRSWSRPACRLGCSTWSPGRAAELSDGAHRRPAARGADLHRIGGHRLRRSSEAVAGRGVKVQLELGGKNPAIVLADADLPDAAEQVSRGAMIATGQRCTATSRVYVEEPAFEDFTAAAGRAGRGPAGRRPLRGVHRRRPGGLGRAAADGRPATSTWPADGECEVLTGGGYSEPARGFWVEPTVLIGAAPSGAR